MILRRNVENQKVLLGPFLDGSNQPFTSATVIVNENSGNGSLQHIAHGVFEYTFDSSETSNSTLRVRLTNGSRSICSNFITIVIDANGNIASELVISGAISLTDETSEDEDNVVYFYNQSPVTKVFLTDSDMSGTPLDFVIEKEDKTSICEVLSITPGTESVSVSIPSIAAQTDKCFTWSLRYSSTNTVFKSGPAIYRYAPIKT